MVRFSLLFGLLVVALSGGHAQVGVSAHYVTDRSATQALTTATDAPGTGWQVGVDYWFRLKQARIEFMPTLAYSSQSHDGVGNTDVTGTTTQGYHFFLNTNIYPFDLKGDCDCPTFSKQGPTFQKGFFIQVSPGMSFWDMEVRTDTESAASEDWAFSLGGAIGFDIGFSDFLTLTPSAGLRHYPDVTWATPNTEATRSDAWMQYLLGLRLGVRF
jgi:hypothetical protein